MVVVTGRSLLLLLLLLASKVGRSDIYAERVESSWWLLSALLKSRGNGEKTKADVGWCMDSSICGSLKGYMAGRDRRLQGKAGGYKI